MTLRPDIAQSRKCDCEVGTSRALMQTSAVAASPRFLPLSSCGPCHGGLPYPRWEQRSVWKSR